MLVIGGGGGGDHDALNVADANSYNSALLSLQKLLVGCCCCCHFNWNRIWTCQQHQPILNFIFSNKTHSSADNQKKKTKKKPAELNQLLDFHFFDLSIGRSPAYLRVTFFMVNLKVWIIKLCDSFFLSRCFANNRLLWLSFVWLVLHSDLQLFLFYSISSSYFNIFSLFFCRCMRVFREIIIQLCILVVCVCVWMFCWIGCARLAFFNIQLVMHICATTYAQKNGEN